MDFCLLNTNAVIMSKRVREEADKINFPFPSASPARLISISRAIISSEAIEEGDSLLHLPLTTATWEPGGGGGGGGAAAAALCVSSLPPSSSSTL